MDNIKQAKAAYGIVKAAREAQGADDLPEWDQVPPEKQIALENAIEAAVKGEPVHVVWAHSVGAKIGPNTENLWSERPPILQFLPKVYFAFGQALATNLTDEVDPLADHPELPLDMVDDIPPPPVKRKRGRPRKNPLPEETPSA